MVDYTTDGESPATTHRALLIGINDYTVRPLSSCGIIFKLKLGLFERSPRCAHPSFRVRLLKPSELTRCNIHFLG
jgi:hypothetical protein